MRRRIFIIVFICICGLGCTGVYKQEYCELVNHLKTVVPAINTDSLFCEECRGLRWDFHCWVDPIVFPFDIRTNPNWHIYSMVIQHNDSLKRNVGLAVVEDKVFKDSTLVFFPPAYGADDTQVVTESIKRRINKSRDICNTIVLQQIPDTYFAGAGWGDKIKLWREYDKYSSGEPTDYTCNFYLNFYYKRKLYQLLYVDKESAKMMQNDSDFTVVAENWFVRRYKWGGKLK